MWQKIVSSIVGAACTYGVLAWASANEFAVTVEQCHDGDTCRVRSRDGLYLNVRLVGIDAPEVADQKGPGQPFGKDARVYLHKLLAGQVVQMRQYDLDIYNRPIVELRYNNRLVNTELLANGYAQTYVRGLRHVRATLYTSAEAQAKRGRKGIWSQTRVGSPAQYRRQRRG